VFREPLDADLKRKEITWIAILCLFALAAWQFLATFLGGNADFSPRSYEEKVLFGGLGAILLCSVLYIALREREQRGINQKLLGNLRIAINQLDERLRQLKSLCSTSTELVGSLEKEHICRFTIDALSRQLPASTYAISWTPPEGERLEFKIENANLQKKESSDGDEGEGALKVISVPLKSQEGEGGSLSAARSQQEAEFSQEEVNLLVTFANMAAKALQSAYLHDSLRQSYLSTLRTLLLLLDARDNYTASHAQRVSSLACRLAEYLKLPEDLQAVMQEFAPLHDLGKVGIPDYILMKQSPLTRAEKKACEQHPAVGEQILRPLRPDARALAMIRHHHEGWDGNGYPDGLAGEEIPLLARILHVVDVFDALLSEKPYAQGCSQLQAIEELLANRGRQFDPLVVNAFVALLDEDGAISGKEFVWDPKPLEKIKKAILL
jgi:HD-GYP domain-containing protein (c-di-GMP phosphodiesterase class II)